MQTIDSFESLLHELGFPKLRETENLHSIAKLYKRRRCGIYVLQFANGDFYVGQSRNIVGRYAAHRRNHRDIVGFRFKSIQQIALNAEEQRCIKALESQGLRLRNISLTSFSYGTKPFDQLMPLEQQNKWIESVDEIDFAGVRAIDDPDDMQRGRYRQKYEQLLQLPFADELIDFTKTYIQTTVPAFRASEMRFWNCTAHARRNGIYIRINIGWQTSLDVMVKENVPEFCWYMTKEYAEEIFGYPIEYQDFSLGDDSFVLTFSDIPDLEVWIEQSDLKQGGGEQVFVSTKGINNAELLMDDLLFRTAIKLFNLGLVQKGICPSSRYHCLDLADRLVE